MTTKNKSLTQQQAWKDLMSHYKNGVPQIKDLFSGDPKRGTKMTAEAEGLFLDYSKNRITDETLSLLLELTRETNLRAKIEAMFRGEKINITENRAVLHVALRAPKGATIMVDGINVVPQVHEVLEKMTAFAGQNSLRIMERLQWQTHQKYRKYRHRRIGPRSCNGL